MMFSSRAESALALSIQRHHGQSRRRTGYPYSVHPIQVALAVFELGETAQIIALLHDVVEDTCDSAEAQGQLLQELEAQFGAEVANGVAALSEPWTSSRDTNWEERKQAYLEQLTRAPEVCRAVALADKTHNLRDLVQGLQHDASETWQRFRGRPKQTLWFYEEVQKIVGHSPPDALKDQLATDLAVLRFWVTQATA